MRHEKIDEAPESQNVDIVTVVQGTAHDLATFTEAEKAHLIRKLDWHLLPLLWVLYSLSVLDRSNLGNARLAGLETDIDLTGWRYNWLGTLFYIACTWYAFGVEMDANMTRYSLSMDDRRMEGLQSTSLGDSDRVLLGICGINPSNS